MNHILHVSAECFPIAKVGGLADVVGALLNYQQGKNFKASLIMPFYNNEFSQNSGFRHIFQGFLSFGHSYFEYQILELKENLGFPAYFVKIQGLLDGQQIYGCPNDVERFLAFQIAVLDWISSLKEKPTLIHSHDHHTGLLAFMKDHCFKYQNLKQIPTVHTIHNAQYQGNFGFDRLGYLPEFNLQNVGLLDWGGSINPLATAIKCSWRVTTVSPSYLEELKLNANGLESLIRQESAKFRGILNGIDNKIWNPKTDKHLIKNYSV